MAKGKQGGLTIYLPDDVRKALERVAAYNGIPAASAASLELQGKLLKRQTLRQPPKGWGARPAGMTAAEWEEERQYRMPEEGGLPLPEDVEEAAPGPEKVAGQPASGARPAVDQGRKDAGGQAAGAPGSVPGR